MSEKTIQSEILLTLGTRSDLKIWRNNTGLAWSGSKCTRLPNGDMLIKNPRPIKFGSPGSADIIGLKSDGTFVAIEVKTPRGRQSEIQKNWGNMILEMGGLYIVCRSASEAEKWL